MADDAIISGPAANRPISRRLILHSSVALGSGAIVATGALGTTVARAETPVFQHGVASGDPLPDGMILWTRVTVSEQAVPGSGRGEPMQVRWEIAEDADFGTVAAAGTITASAENDHTAKVDVSGLRSGRTYFYRFTAQGQTSPVGRTRTAPALSETPDQLRFAVVSCANWEAGFFAAYRHIAERTDLDAVIHLGDYMYEYPRGEYGGRTGSVRPHEPAHELVTLADYRVRYGQYRTDPDLARLHAAVPFICTWDDHESADNAWSGGASEHDPAVHGSWSQRRAASARAYLDWMPVRGRNDSAPTRIYRRFRFGTLAELAMLDLRSYRDRAVAHGPELPHVDDPARTITGDAQMDWLTAGLRSSPVRWKLVGNSVMIAPLLFPPLDPATAAAFTELMGLPRSGLPVNLDQWDGYTADRQRLFQAITDGNIPDVVFLTGDIHSSWAADLPVDAAYPNGPTAGTEFVVPSVTSSSVGEVLRSPPRTAAVSAEQAVSAANHHLRYVELDSHGYGLLDLAADEARMDWFYAVDVTDRNTGQRHGAAFAVRSGGRVEPRTTPAS